MIFVMHSRLGSRYLYGWMPPARRRRRRTRFLALWCLRRSLTPVLVVPLLLAGCGSSKPKPDPVREKRLVAEANALCISIRHSVHEPRTQQVQAHRLAAVEVALRAAAAYLPAGRSLDEAHAKRVALRRELSALIQKQADKDKHKKSGPTIVTVKSPRALYNFEESIRRGMQAYNAMRALGLTQCARHPPRAPISG
jgi:hypothetical protein